MVVARVVRVPYPKLEADLGYFGYYRESPIHLVTYHYRVESEKGVHKPCFRNPSNAYHFVGEVDHLDAPIVEYARCFYETPTQYSMAPFCDHLSEDGDLVEKPGS